MTASITVASEYLGREQTELPREVAEQWSQWHEGTAPEDAPYLMYEDARGAYVCECCGVNYNPKVVVP